MLATKKVASCSSVGRESRSGLVSTLPCSNTALVDIQSASTAPTARDSSTTSVVSHPAGWAGSENRIRMIREKSIIIPNQKGTRLEQETQELSESKSYPCTRRDKKRASGNKWGKSYHR